MATSGDKRLGGKNLVETERKLQKNGKKYAVSLRRRHGQGSEVIQGKLGGHEQGS